MSSGGASDFGPIGRTLEKNSHEICPRSPFRTRNEPDDPREVRDTRETVWYAERPIDHGARPRYAASAEAGGLHASAGELGQERLGLHQLGQPRGARSAGSARPSSMAVSAATAPPATPGRSMAPRISTRMPSSARPRTSTRTAPNPASGWGRRSMGRPAVRRSRRVAARRAVTRPTPENAGTSKQRVGKRSPVAVGRADGIGEPAELPTRARRTALPPAVAPVDGHAPERVVVLTRAGRATRAHPRHVDLVDGVEPVGGEASQHAGEAGREGGTHGDRDPPRVGLGPEVEQRPHVVDGVGGGDHGDPATHERPSERHLLAGRGGQHHHIGFGCRGVRTGLELGLGTERRRHLLRSGSTVVSEDHLGDRVGGRELTSRPGAHGTQAHHGDPHQASSSGESSRHPPRCGGVPPVPRTRKMAAMIPAAPTATSARRISVTSAPGQDRGDGGLVGLAGIEPATSPLSGVRSNQLSYSPERVPTVAAHGRAMRTVPTTGGSPRSEPRPLRSPRAGCRRWSR